MKPSKKPVPDLLDEAADKKLRSLRKEMERQASSQSFSEVVEAVGIAIVAALKTSRAGDLRPSDHFSEAAKIVDQAKRFVASRIRSPLVTETRFSTPQAMAILRYKNKRSFWRAVSSFFAKDDVVEIKQRKSFTYAELFFLRDHTRQRRRQNAAMARKALVAKKSGV